MVRGADNSSTGFSVASDQDRFDTAYDAFRDLENSLYSRGVTSEDAAGVPLLEGQEKLQELVHLSRTSFFFGQCCARCDNSGSHEYMLDKSSVDNSNTDCS